MSATAPAQPIRVPQAPAKRLDIDALFLKLSFECRDFRMERTPHGEIVIMSPLGTGWRARG